MALINTNPATEVSSRSVQGNSKNYADPALREAFNKVGGALTDYTRKTDFDLAVLKQAVADGNLEKYGLKPGDQKTINGHTYVIAGLNPMKGTTTPFLTLLRHGTQVATHTLVLMDVVLAISTRICITT